MSTLIEFAEALLAPLELFEDTKIHLSALEGDGDGMVLLLTDFLRGKTLAGALWAAYHGTTHPEMIPGNHLWNTMLLKVTQDYVRRAERKGLLPSK
ncbi:MAG: hypothetical protein AB7L09_00060 [Nitrospira sp.]